MAWTTSSVRRCAYDERVRYSRIYDYLYKKGAPLNEIRVSSLIHEKSFKALVDLPEFEPRTYDRLVRRIGGMTIGHLYGKDAKMLRARSLPKGHASWRAYRDFLLATYPDESKRPIFVRRFARHLDNDYVARQQCRQLLLNDYEDNLPVDNSSDPRERAIERWRALL